MPEAKPRSWTRHLNQRNAIRLTTVLASAGFWVLVVILFGPKAALIGGAAWIFSYALRDLFTLRVRIGVDDAGAMGAWARPLAADVAATTLRLGALFALQQALVAVSAEGAAIAASLSVMVFVILGWAREWLLSVAVRAGVGGATASASFLRNLAGLAALGLFSTQGFEPVSAIPAALAIREGVAIVVIFGCIVLARLTGLRLSDGFDDEDGVDAIEAIVPPGMAQPSRWRQLCIDNLVWARWRWLQFTSRQVAGGVFGPIGNLVMRIGFAFRTPAPYRERHKSRFGMWRKLMSWGGTALSIAVLGWLAHRFDLLPAFGLLGLAYVARFAGLSANYGFWSLLVRTGRAVQH
jgi:hypothetical protein